MDENTSQVTAFASVSFLIIWFYRQQPWRSGRARINLPDPIVPPQSLLVLPSKFQPVDRQILR